MHVIRHSDPDAFLAAAAPMAARGEASASFFSGWAHAMKRNPPATGERVYLATFRDRASYGVAMRRDDGPVIIGQSDAAAAIRSPMIWRVTVQNCRAWWACFRQPRRSRSSGAG